MYRCRFPLTTILYLVLCILGAGVSLAQNSLDPSIALASGGRIAVFHAMSAPDRRAVLTIADSIDAPGADTIIVNRDMPGAALTGSLAAGAKDDFLVVWEQNGGASSQLWCARYSASGTPIGQPLLVTDSAGMNARMPRIAAGSDGRSVVVWQDYRRQQPDLMYQLLDPALKKVGGNRLLAAFPGIPFTPVPALSPKNDIAFVYQQTLADTFHVCARIAPWNKPLGRVVILDRGAQNRAYSTNPDCVWLGANELAAVWKDYRTRNSDIYLQRFSRQGRLRGGNLRVNDDTTQQWQRLPRIAAGGSRACVVWEDYRNDPRNQMGDVYAQWFGVNGARLAAENARVNTSNEPTSQTAPAVVLDAKGRAVVVWCDAQGETVTISGRHLVPGEHGQAARTTGGLRRPFK